MDNVFDFTQLEKIIIAFVADFELKISKLIDGIPAYIMQVGDTSYYYDKKFQKIDDNKKELYQKTPRVVFVVDENISDADDEKTNINNTYTYKHFDTVFRSDVAFVPKKMVIYANIVCPTFFEYLKNIQKVSTIIEYPNVFTYNYIGNTYTVQYQKTTRTGERPSMDVGSATRNFNIKVDFELNFCLDVPRTQTIKNIDDSYINGVSIDLTSKGTIDETYNQTITNE